MANEAADEGFIKLNGKDAKPSARLKAGDVIEIDMWNYYKSVKILQVPEKNSIPKQDLDKFIEVLEYRAKNDEF